jgi:hypothetical protein
MRMRAKSRIFYFSFVFLTLGSTGALVAILPTTAQPLAGMMGLICLCIFGIAQFVVLVCPHCQASATRTPSGIFTPFVGTHCRYCLKEY